MRLAVDGFGRVSLQDVKQHQRRVKGSGYLGGQGQRRFGQARAVEWHQDAPERLARRGSGQTVGRVDRLAWNL